MSDFYEPGDTGSFLNFRRKMLKKMKASGVSEQISSLLQETFKEMLESENMVLSKPEKKILMDDISIQLLNELVKQIKEK